MQYNTLKEKLIIPEYGRHIQQMVDHCKTIENDEDRNDFAKAIIEVMGNLNPHLRDVMDFKHKLWDQLFIMADFDLKVDSPYPIPSAEEFSTPPKRIPYPSYMGKYRYYGRNVKKMIEVASSLEDEEKKLGLAKAIANQMKKSYLLWNKDEVDDSVIYRELKLISEGKLDFVAMEEASEHEVSLASKHNLMSGHKRSKNFSKRRYNNRSKYKK